MKRILTITILTLIIGISNYMYSQEYDPARHCYIDPATDECIPNTILSAMPFLRIVPDARGAALGDAGIALSPDPSAMHFNAAKLAMSDKEFELSTTYTPWLKNLGLNDLYLAYLAGYNKFDKLQAVGYSIRYFSLGEIQYTNTEGIALGTGKPSEFEVAAAYARKLSNKFAAGLTAKFIYSNLAENQRVNGVLIKAATAFAVDLSMYYKTKLNVGGYKSKLNIGLTLSELGNAISYTDNTDKDYLPQNLGLGGALEMNFDDYNSMTFVIELNKMLLPTPDLKDTTRFHGSPFTAAIESFSDAPGGFVEEMREISYSIGIEYWYDKQFAIRTGYFYENKLKGDRKYLTIGLGLNYNVYGMGISYLIPTTNTRNPLDGTLRFTFSMDFTKSNYKE